MLTGKLYRMGRTFKHGRHRNNESRKKTAQVSHIPKSVIRMPSPEVESVPILKVSFPLALYHGAPVSTVTNLRQRVVAMRRLLPGVYNLTIHSVINGHTQLGCFMAYVTLCICIV